jgi:multidrug efflux pump subunit AcrA (membrane-fusion protein)
MANPRSAPIRIVVGAVVALVVLGAAIFAVPPLRAMLGFSGDEKPASAKAEKTPAAEVIYDAAKKPGLRLTKLAVEGLGILPVAVKQAAPLRELPPQVGTINFDNETLFAIPSRFPGEIAEIAQVEEDGPVDPNNPSGPPLKKKRSLRYGDRVRQGSLLAVVHSTTLGTAKAALVDAVCSLKLSTETLERHYKLYAEGGISLATLRQSERQQQFDSNALLTAERTLLTMKLSEDEVNEIKAQAKEIATKANEGLQKRDAKEEAEKWARVEIRVPWLNKDYPRRRTSYRELTVVEKNTNLYAMVDPINTSTPLFKLADLSRMQIWVHPPEEFLPVFRQMLDSPDGAEPTWGIEVQAFPQDKLPPMKFTQIAPSLEPYQHTPMLMGYLDNPAGKKYVVGQFVTATILVPSEPNTVEIPTQALNEVNGEALVFVQPDKTKNEFFLRRVAVVNRFKDVTQVRTELTDADRKQNALDAGKKTSKGSIEPLRAGELVVTQGVVELTAALDDLLTKEGTENKK